MSLWSSLGWEDSEFASWMLWGSVCYASIYWFSTSVKAASYRVLFSVIYASTHSTMLVFLLLYPRDVVVWLGRSLLYAVWAPVKWVLKLVRFWSAEGL